MCFAPKKKKQKQTRISQISTQLELGNLDQEENEAYRSPSPPPVYDTEGQRLNTREVRSVTLAVAGIAVLPDNCTCASDTEGQFLNTREVRLVTVPFAEIVIVTGSFMVTVAVAVAVAVTAFLIHRGSVSTPERFVL